MLPADAIVLDLLEPYMSDIAYDFVVSEVEKAGCISGLTNVAALTELVVAKKKFGSRSAAGQYAAQVRWAGQKPEMYAPDAQGNKYRTATMNGEPVQFKVSPATASDAKEGDIISVGSNRVPMTVTSVKPVGDKLVITTTNLNSTSRAETTIAANAPIRKWTPDNKPPQSQPSRQGALNPSRAVDSSKITGAELRYINEGKTGPDRVRRANEVIDRYATSGKDVTKPQSRSPRGGAQWLESGGQ